MLAAGLLVATGFFVGSVLGAPGQIRQSDLAIQTAFRGLSAAVAVAITSFPTEPKVLVMLIIVLLMSLPVLLVVAPTVLRRKAVAAAH
jgi:hypothetical protein